MAPHNSYSKKLPKYEELALAITEYIYSQQLYPGCSLPGIRKLTELFGSSRNSVTEALHYLKDEGMVHINPSVGVFVAQNAQIKQLYGLPNWKKYQDAGEQVTFGNQHFWRDDGVEICTDKEFSSSEYVADAMLIAEKRIRETSLLEEYYLKGLISARESVCNYLKTKNIYTSPDQIIVTVSYRFAMNMVLKMIAGHGSTIYVAAPSLQYYHLRHNSQAKIIPLPTESDGINTGYFEEKAGKAPASILCCCPTLDLPTSITTSLEKRQALLDITRKHRMPLIELDLMSDMRKDALPPIKSMEGSEHVIYIGSFMHTMPLGVRLSWLVMPRALVNEFSYNMNYFNGWSDTYSQLLLEIMLDKGLYDTYIRQLRPKIAKRLELVDTLLKKRAWEGWAWDRMASCAYMALTLPKGINVRTLLADPSCPSYLYTSLTIGDQVGNHIYLMPLKNDEAGVTREIGMIFDICEGIFQSRAPLI